MGLSGLLVARHSTGGSGRAFQFVRPTGLAEDGLLTPSIDSATAFLTLPLVELHHSQHCRIRPEQATQRSSLAAPKALYRFQSCPGRGIVTLTRRRGRVVQARACKALYMGSIPIVASQPLTWYIARSEVLFVVTRSDRE